MTQGIFLCTLSVCTLGFGSKAWNMALNKGIWDPKPRVTNIKGTNLKSLSDSEGMPNSKTSTLDPFASILGGPRALRKYTYNRLKGVLGVI